MKAVIELAGDAQSGGVGDASGCADFNESGGSCGRDAEDETSGAAHEDVRRLIVDRDGGQAEAVGTKIDSRQLDFAIRQSGGGEDVVDTRQVADGRRGLRGGAGHIETKCEGRQNQIRAKSEPNS
jgi:hypothetical protein